jgi:lysozyme
MSRVWCGLALLGLVGCGAGRRGCVRREALEGVDVSSFQGQVDWAQVAQAGKRFAFVRVSDGISHPDVAFARNYQGARAAGLARGAYQLFHPGDDVAAQANLLAAAVGTPAAGDLPPVLDLEVDDGLAGPQVEAAARAWLAAVAMATGQTPIVYTTASFLDDRGLTALPGALWVANYGASCPLLPDGYATWQFWQYDDHGTVPGVVGAVDLDRFDGSATDLTALGH